MSPTAVFTTTISPQIMAWLQQHSKETHRTRRSILEEALKRYQEGVKRRHLIESFKRAAKDPEMKELADQGLSDYVEQLSSR